MCARAFWTIVHRWAGLTIAAFVIVTGLTGSILAFQPELLPLLAPARYPLPPSPAAKAIDWVTLHDIAEQRSGGMADTLPLYREGGVAAIFSFSAATERPALGFDEIVLDPYDGHEIDRATSGRLSDGAAQILPFIYLLHDSLVLGDWGIFILGIAALIWTIDCFVGFYLTIPTGRRRWWGRWRSAWSIRLPTTSSIRLNYDLHRASGLWLWPILLVFAWSAVGFNLRTVYDPAMHALTGMAIDFPAPAPPATLAPRLGWREALTIARLRAAEAARDHGITIERERELRFRRSDNSYNYVVRTSRDVRPCGRIHPSIRFPIPKLNLF